MTYTFILNFRGGTYIEQATASDVMTATHLWAQKVANEPAIEHLDGEAFLKVFYYKIEVFHPNEIEGCPNVWHLYFLMGRYEVDIHIIKTSEAPEPSASALVATEAGATH